MSLEVEIELTLKGITEKDFLNSVKPDPILQAGYSYIKHNNYNFGVSLVGLRYGLTDDADWEGQGVFLYENIKEAFRNFLINLSKYSESSFEMTLIWSGDRVEKEIKVTLPELIDIISHDQLYNKCRYIIST